MTVLYFSATGNGLYIAKEIGGTLISIPQAIKAKNFHFKDDRIGIVFPIYGWAVPVYIRKFLNTVKLESDYIFAVMSYGMLAGAASDHLLDFASKRGIDFKYVNTIKTVDNYLPGFEMIEQKKGEEKKQIEAHLAEIISDIKAKKEWTPKNSFVSLAGTKMLLKFNPYKPGVGITDKYCIEDTCISCGICASVCPTDNITVKDKPAFANNCIACLACTHNCPQNAIRLSGEKSRERFRNKNVSLKEIIEANK